MNTTEIYNQAVKGELKTGDSIIENSTPEARLQADFEAALMGWNSSSITREVKSRLLSQRDEMLNAAMTLANTASSENGILLRTILCGAATINNTVKFMETGTYGSK